MTRQQLFEKIKEKQSFLCVGLDTDPAKIPSHLSGSDDPVFEFNKQIIDETAEFCVAYKPNMAFYEALGAPGIESLQKTLDYIPDDIFTIADAKRGDIGNTTNMYAKAFFERMQVDAITVSPYMGHDSILPYFEYDGKWVIVLAITSNPGSDDFQHLDVAGDHSDFFDIEDMELFELVVKKCVGIGTTDQLMFVVGANKASYMEHIRRLAPDNFLLIPGVGAQGGDLEGVVKAGINDHCGLLVNSSRGIIYASDGQDFARAAGEAAKSLQVEMASLLNNYLPT